VLHIVANSGGFSRFPFENSISPLLSNDCEAGYKISIVCARFYLCESAMLRHSKADCDLVLLYNMIGNSLLKFLDTVYIMSKAYAYHC